ncbi:MAG: hypothetical protein JWL64_2297 [Frankiales bacterium]|nr:hypothetical protein [Frankiales bacterium]
MEDVRNDPDYGKPRHSDVGVRARIRSTPGGAHALKVAVFLLGLFFIALGGFAIVLPGPLTIPPVLLGVWIWSTEFAFADRLLDRAKVAGQEAWEQAKKRPVVSGIFTAGGLVVAAVAIWAFVHFDVLARLKDVVGL